MNYGEDQNGIGDGTTYNYLKVTDNAEGCICTLNEIASVQEGSIGPMIYKAVCELGFC